ncbi:MAG: hypothetical protein ACJ74Y_11360 [Bryobacteraceae bacterium]
MVQPNSGPTADLTKSLNGSLEFQVTNGQLKNVNILNEVAKIGKFLNSAPAQAGSGTALRKLAGTLFGRRGGAKPPSTPFRQASSAR